MTRVAILGNAGGGKSTLSRLLACSKSLPVFQLDKLQWNAGWIPTPQNEFDLAHEEILKQERWIIDGVGSIESIERRIQASDTIVFIDNPLWLHYWWASKRQFMCIFRPRPDFVEGCPMLPMTIELIKMMWRLHHSLRPRIIKVLDEYSDEKVVYHIRSPKQLALFEAAHC